MNPKPLTATVQVSVAICCKCPNEASVTMVDDHGQLIQVCPEHHIGRFQEMMVERVRAIFIALQEHQELLAMDGLSALFYIRRAMLGKESAE